MSWDARGWVRGWLGLELSRGLVRFVGQIEEDVEELLRLADEEPVIHKTLKRGNSAAELCGSGANDGYGLEIRVYEVRWLGHDEIGLQRIACDRLGIRLSLGGRQRRECYGCAGTARSVVGV